MAVDYVTEAEAKVFAAKLATFGEQLTPKEQALLREILLRAAENEDNDVEGHSSSCRVGALAASVM